MPDLTFDLTALAKRLFSENRHLKLAGKIRRAQELASLHTDLTMAIESLDALDALMKLDRSDDFSGEITEFALLTNAVLQAIKDIFPHDGPKVIYGEMCRLGSSKLAAEQITFKQIPYDVKMR